jgi:hypothetical protein
LRSVAGAQFGKDVLHSPLTLVTEAKGTATNIDQMAQRLKESFERERHREPIPRWQSPGSDAGGSDNQKAERSPKIIKDHEEMMKTSSTPTHLPDLHNYSYFPVPNS